MRMLTILVAVLSITFLTACANSDDGSGQSHRGLSGPYVGGGGGAGF
jgi:hypothetical protein